MRESSTRLEGVAIVLRDGERYSVGVFDLSLGIFCIEACHPTEEDAPGTTGRSQRERRGEKKIERGLAGCLVAPSLTPFSRV